MSAFFRFYYTTSYDTRITYARNVNPIFMSNVRCQGNESSLTECSFNDRLHIGNCSYHSAGAVCFNDKDGTCTPVPRLKCMTDTQHSTLRIHILHSGFPIH